MISLVSFRKNTLNKLKMLNSGRIIIRRRQKSTVQSIFKIVLNDDKRGRILIIQRYREFIGPAFYTY